jgi:predicted transcriptional regulator
MNPTRRKIRAQVYATVGIHFNELVRNSAFAVGQIQYHIHRLINDGELNYGEFYGQTHYYPPEYDKRDQIIVALLRRETSYKIVRYLSEHKSSTPSEITDELVIARGTLEYHLDRLIESDLVEKQYDDKARVILRLEDPEETTELIAII